MAQFGNLMGTKILFGRINVAVPGTPAPISQNISTNTPFSSVANPVSIRCSEITFKAPGGGTGAAGGNVANTGAVYVCYKGGSRAIQNSIIVDLAPGQGYVESSSIPGAVFDPSQYVIDADNGGDGCRVSGTVV